MLKWQYVETDDGPIRWVKLDHGVKLVQVNSGEKTKDGEHAGWWFNSGTAVFVPDDLVPRSSIPAPVPQELPRLSLFERLRLRAIHFLERL